MRLSLIQKPVNALKPGMRNSVSVPVFTMSICSPLIHQVPRWLDTDGKGVECITETGLVANGQHFDVDCIIYASGFEVGSEFTSRAGFDLTGRSGLLLSEHWAEGMRTLHGVHMHGFPNAFMVQMGQAANFAPNVPHNIVDHADTIARVVAFAES